MPKSRTTWGILLLVGVALALRLLTVALVGTASWGPVTFEHGEIAQNLLDGQGFSVKFLGATGPTSQQAPLYPALLAVLYAVFGPSTAAIVAMQLIQCLVGAAGVVAIVWLAWSLLPARREIGWSAGWFAALYPPHIYMITHVQVAVWACLLLTLAIALAAWPTPRRWSSAAAAGCASGLLVLFEPILALAVPVVAVVYLGKARRGGQSLARSLPPIALIGAIAAMTIAPWIVRNYRVHGEFVFVKSTFGYAFWQGNNPLSWGTDKVPRPLAEEVRTAHDNTLADANRALWAARHKTFYVDDLALTSADYAFLATMSEPERSRELGRRAMSYVRDEPGEYAKRCLRRLRYFLLFDETNPKAANRLYRAATIVWLTLAGIGLLLTSRREWSVLWPLAALFLAVTAFHTLTIVSARFRLPLESIAFLWVGQTIGPLVVRLVSAWRSAASQAEPVVKVGGHPLAAPHFRPQQPQAAHPRKR
jgi:hypothetical protein